jgi:hypothetical protein
MRYSIRRLNWGFIGAGAVFVKTACAVWLKPRTPPGNNSTFPFNLLRYNAPGGLPPGVSPGLDNLDVLLILQRPLAGLDAGLLRGLTALLAELADALQQELRAFAVELSGERRRFLC